MDLEVGHPKGNVHDMKRICLLLFPLLLGSWALPLQAQVRQPDGTVIPVGNNLSNFLRDEGERIDVVARAATTPHTFNPLCELTFTVIARGGGQNNSFGWYNATGQRPSRDDLHEFLSCSDGPGTTRTLDIAQHSAYRGGEIGFFMATTQARQGGQPGSGTMPGNCVQFDEGGPVDSTLGFLYFSEPQWNDDNLPGQDNFIHLLIYDSGVYPDAFYFGWEDLHGQGNNDNDFEDLLTRVEGIICSGGGGDCATGLEGICSAGTMQCRSGSLSCVQHNEPRAESCNGLDDDCNGLVDDGAICPDGEICHRGACVPRCFPGEFSCFGGLVCDEGVCVEPACRGVRCDGGTICVDGSCKAPCDGVACPLGQVCRIGACVDPCEGMVCDQGQVCELGVCKPTCGCLPCQGDRVCAADGRCVEPGCEDLSCDEGTICVGGSCVDACEGAVCPQGEVCSEGRCVEGEPGAGGSGGTQGTGGSGGSTGTGGQGGQPPGAGGTGPGAGGSAAQGQDGEGGCGCSSGAGGAGAGWLGLLALLRRRATSRSRG